MILGSATTQRIAVPFAGEGEGVGELTWSQKELWPAFEMAGKTIFMGGVMPLPAGGTVEENVAVLRFVMSRHQSLRTRFRCDEAGRPVRQVLEAAGETALEVVQVGEGEDPNEVAEAAFLQFQDRTIDYANEWPLRLAVVQHRGVLTHAVAAYNHLAIDAFGLDALSRDLENLDRATGHQKAPVGGTPPLEQARHQNSPAGRRISDSAMRHWERLLRTVPARRFREPGGGAVGSSPRYWQVGYRSPAAHLAVRSIAARTEADTSAVLLAAYAVALARVTGSNPSVLRVVFNNRFRPGFADSVSVLGQTGLCVIDVADVAEAGFDGLVARVWRSALGAGMHAYYDPDQLDQLVEAIGRERGEEVDVRSFYNDRRRARRPDPADPAPTGEQIRAALAHSALRWDYRQDRPNERLSIQVNYVPDTVDYTVCADTQVVGAAELEALVRGLEAVLVEAA